MELNKTEWALSAKKTLHWFIEFIGDSNWLTRKKKVVDYLKGLKAKTYAENEIQSDEFDKLFIPIVVYDDWIAWYMYLVESLFERPVCNEPFQSARILPFFSAIGNSIAAIKKTRGIDDRLRVMFNERQNKPDSTLFELAVGALYLRNGFHVEFPEAHPGAKTTDLKVSRDGQVFWVECKRMAKVNDFAEKERRDWQKRVKHLFNAMRILKIFAYAEIVFKVPVDSTDEVILGGFFWQYIQTGMIKTGELLSNELLDFKAKEIDLNGVNRILAGEPIRPSTPRMINLITNNFDAHGNYTHIISPSLIASVAKEDEFAVLNDFYAGISEVYMAKWECVAEASLNQKAKGVQKLLAKAVGQIPDDGSGIIHIGFETVTGQAVETLRHEKIKQSISKFDFGKKRIESVFCNGVQLLPSLDGYDWAETTMFFQNEENMILSSLLLLNLPPTSSPDVPHWLDDL